MSHRQNKTPGAAVLPDEDSDFSDNEPSSVPSSFPSSDLSMIPPSAPFIPDDSDGQQEEYEELEEEIEEYADEITSIPTSSPNFNVTAINSTMCPPIIASVKGETSLEDSLLSSRALLYASLGLNVILLILMALCGLLLRKDQRRRRIATAAQPPPPAPGEEKASTVELSANVPPQMHELEAAMALPRERHRSNSLDASEEYVCRENSICVKNGEPKMKGYRYGTMGSES